MGTVTPRAGVWIEIGLIAGSVVRGDLSLLVQECGLKWIIDMLSLDAFPSLLVQECGLKCVCLTNAEANISVTPHTGVTPHFTITNQLIYPP